MGAPLFTALLARIDQNFFTMTTVPTSSTTAPARKTRTPSTMSLKIDLPNPEILKPRITIFGVGGAGGNAINNMIRSNLEGVEFVAANTDSQALQHSLAKHKIQLGLSTTKGLGAGSFPDRGRVAAEENVEDIEKLVEGNNMIFIAAGMGGGTGTGAAPVIGQIAREREILTVGVVTKPFHFEGKYRMETAEKGIEELKKHVDTLIIIPNQNLFRIANEHTTFESAFKMADDVLQAGVRGITDLITMPGLVNLDFADIRTIMTKMGKAMMGTGEASGDNRAIIAVEAAVSNPLLDDISIKGAKGVLVNMTGGPDMTLFEADMAVNAIKKEVDQNANIIFGSAFNENMKGKIRISVVATGIDGEEFKRETREVPEPSRFKINLNNSFGGNKAAEAATKPIPAIPVTESFFDPGLSAKSRFDDIDEIGDNNFKPKKNFLREENPNYSTNASQAAQYHATDEIEEEIFTPREEIVEEPHAEVEEFFMQEEAEIVEFSKPKEAPKTAAKAAPRKKKESSGFGLFGFMNSVKPRVEEEISDEIEEEIVEHKKSAKIAPRVEAREEEIASKPRPQQASVKTKIDGEAEKKRQKFFGSTIFDEPSQANDFGKIDDDILNVPAFFRRKK